MTDHLDTRAARLAAALDDFLNSSPDVEAAAVVSFDGLPMASALPDDLEEDRVGAMSAALLSLGEQAALGLGRGQLNQVFVEGEHGFVFLMSCRDQAVLAAVAGRSAKIGFMLFEMRRAAERVGTVLAPTELASPATEALAEGETWPEPAGHDFEDSPVQQAVDAFASPAEFDAPAEFEASAEFDAPAAVDVPSSVEAPSPFGAPAPADAPSPFGATPVADDAPFAALGELRAVSSPAPVTPPPPASHVEPVPAPVTEGNHDAEREAAHESDLLTVLATQPYEASDDHDLLTEALFEVRRATGGDSADANAWPRQESSANGWG